MVLYLVRHAEPAASPEVDSRDWPLTAEGRTAALDLMAELPVDAVFMSSGERKARETLVGVVQPRIDLRLNEVVRADESWSGDFRTRRRRWVEGHAVPGWESRSAAARRFDAAIAAGSDSNPRSLVAASHGMVITNWLVHRGLLPAERAGEFWSQLAFPDCLVVDGATLGRL